MLRLSPITRKETARTRARRSFFGLGRWLFGRWARRFSFFGFMAGLLGLGKVSNRRAADALGQLARSRAGPARASRLGWVRQTPALRTSDPMAKSERELDASADDITATLAHAEHSLANQTPDLPHASAAEAVRATLSGIDDSMQRWNIRAEELTRKAGAKASPAGVALANAITTQRLNQIASVRPAGKPVSLARPPRQPRFVAAAPAPGRTTVQVQRMSQILNQLAARSASPSAKLTSLRVRIDDIATSLYQQRMQTGVRTGVSLERRKAPRAVRATLPAPSMQPKGVLLTGFAKKADETA